MKMFLPAFIIVFMLAFLVWNFIFRKQLQKGSKYKLESFIQSNQPFQVMLGLAALIIGFYSFNPEYYNLLIPIDSLDRPFINDTGVFILRAAFFWLISAIIHTYLLLQAAQTENKNELIRVYIYAQKLVLLSVAFMLTGLAVTISSIAAIILCFTGIFYYYLKVYRPTTK